MHCRRVVSVPPLVCERLWSGAGSSGVGAWRQARPRARLWSRQAAAGVVARQKRLQHLAAQQSLDAVQRTRAGREVAHLDRALGQWTS